MEKHRRPQTRCRCFCTLLLLLIFVALFVFLGIGAASPEFSYKALTSLMVRDDARPTDSAPKTLTNSTAKFSEMKQEFREAVKAIGISSLAGLIVLILLVCLVMCCCDNLTLSSEFLVGFRLILFAAFTKLPIVHQEKNFIRIDDHNVTLQLDTDLESPEKVVSNPKRYIFVNFSAWEYAGSDNLWAGIATNLSDAIESEFGSIVSRLFRIFDLKEIPADGHSPHQDCCHLYVELGNDVAEENLQRILKGYGVLVKLHRYSSFVASGRKQPMPGHGTWWVAEYSSFHYAEAAKEALKNRGITASFEDPLSPDPREVIERMKKKISEKKEKDQPLIESGADKNVDDSLEKKKTGFWSHFRKYPKRTCHFPVFYWTILLTISAIMLPMITYLVAQQLSLNVFKSSRAVPVGVQILAWMPGISGSIYVILGFIWAMFHSQRSRIKSALEGTDKNLAGALGMMDKIKHEVHVITKLIHCAEFSHQKKYTVVITIDDLDRVPHDKVKSVLEAVSILLSDQSSPFACVIALDSRVAVKCIEEGMGLSLLKANVNGHEYLKKIINLPFCLPEVDNTNKSQYIRGLVDQSDVTDAISSSAEIAKSFVHEKVLGNYNINNNNDRDVAGYKETNLSDAPEVVPDGASAGRNLTDAVISNEGLHGSFQLTPKCAGESSRNHAKDFFDFPKFTLSYKEFFFECRRFFQDDSLVQQHLHGNPRNIKRIFNVLSLTAVIVKFVQTELETHNDLDIISQSTSTSLMHKRHSILSKQFARDLVRWIVLTDQWPYRVSYILQVIEDADQRSKAGKKEEGISDDTTLLEIYESHVLKEFKNLTDNDKPLLSLDANPDTFYSFLSQLSISKFDKRKAKQLKQFTVNLDQSLRHSIAHQRTLSAFAEKTEADDKTAAESGSPASPNTSTSPGSSKM